MSIKTITAVEAETSPAPTMRSGEAERKIGSLFLQFLVIGAFLLFWEYAGIFGFIDPFFISSPTAVGAQLYTWFTDGSIYNHLIVTLREALIGWVIGSIAGILIGFCLGRVSILRRVFVPLLHLLNTLPRIALAPLFIFWFGIGEPSKVILVITIIIFIMIFNTYNGVLTVNEDYLLTAKLFGKTEWQILTQVVFPWCVPWIFVGLKLGLAWSVSGAVVGEFIAARAGIGYLIFNAAANLDNAAVLAGCVVLLGIALVFFGVVSVAERQLLKWRPAGL